MLTRDVFLAFAATLFAASCTTGPDPGEEVRAKAYGQIRSHTLAVPLGQNRVRIEASTPFVQNGSVLAYDLLARAAAAAIEQDKPRFAFVYTDFRDEGIGALLAPSISLPRQEWVGRVEDLMKARADQSFGTAGEGRFGYREAVAIVVLLEDGEAEGRPTFAANEVFDALLEERIERKNIQPSRRFSWPF